MRDKTNSMRVIWSAALLTCLLFLAVPAAAIDYYADIVLDLANDGIAEISGITNHPTLIEGKTSNLTSKKGEYWTFQLSPADTFSNYVFKLILPENAIVNYVKAPSQVRIAEENKRISIIGTGADQKLSISVQYTFDTSPQKNLLTELLTWFGPAFALIALGLALLMLGNKKKSQPIPPKAKLPYNPDTLTKRQSQILEIIISSKDVVTQAMIERVIKIPKSSVSRNIDSLARKGIVKKEKRGMSNILTLVK